MDVEGIPIHVLAEYFISLFEFISGHFQTQSLSLPSLLSLGKTPAEHHQNPCNVTWEG